MDMDTEHSSDVSGLDIPMILTIGLVSLNLTIALIFAVQALYYGGLSQEVDRKVIAVSAPDSDSKIAEQKAKLTRYGWLNREKGQVGIPISRAMDLVVKDVRNQSAEDAAADENSK